MNFRADNKWWYYWQYGKYNFSNNSDISYILPYNVESVVDEYSSSLIEVLNKTASIIDEVLKN